MNNLWINPETLGPMFSQDSKHSKKEYKYDGWYDYYLFTLFNLAKTRYIWKGLPPEIDSYWIEQKLITHGSLYAYKDKLGNLRMSPGAETGYNIYDQPVEGTIVTNTTQTSIIKLLPERVIFQGDQKNAVYIQDNLNNIPLWYQLQFWAQKLATIKGKIDANLRSLATFSIIGVSPKTMKSVSQAMNNHLDGEPLWYEDKDVANDLINNINAVNLNPNIYIDQLQQYLEKLWSEMVEQLGVNVVKFEKKERLLVDEVNGNNDMISRYTSEGLDLRKRAAKAINEMFDTNITVEEPEAQDGSMEKRMNGGDTNDDSQGLGNTTSDNNDRNSEQQ